MPTNPRIDDDLKSLNLALEQAKVEGAYIDIWEHKYSNNIQEFSVWVFPLEVQKEKGDKDELSSA